VPDTSGGAEIDPLMNEDSIAAETAEPADSTFEKLTGGDTVDARNLGDTKTAPAKKSGTPPARVLEEPPHKKVDLNSVQSVLQKYIDQIEKTEAGYIFEYKTDAAYEIWSLLLAELAGL
jgi:hypothetical protein